MITVPRTAYERSARPRDTGHRTREQDTGRGSTITFGMPRKIVDDMFVIENQGRGQGIQTEDACHRRIVTSYGRGTITNGMCMVDNAQGMVTRIAFRCGVYTHQTVEHHLKPRLLIGFTNSGILCGFAIVDEASG